ncbi:hypothetical protein SDC9_86704 [bioreactor metagenome]|uniref:Uncharacterized protein n=1 Tax=bioreactor metagenome TaxID=1076179 RepID=A0A644ZGU5_9ZZZZ
MEGVPLPCGARQGGPQSAAQRVRRPVARGDGPGEGGQPGQPAGQHRRHVGEERTSPGAAAPVGQGPDHRQVTRPQRPVQLGRERSRGPVRVGVESVGQAGGELGQGGPVVDGGREQGLGERHQVDVDEVGVDPGPHLGMPLGGIESVEYQQGRGDPVTDVVEPEGLLGDGVTRLAVAPVVDVVGEHIHRPGPQVAGQGDRIVLVADRREGEPRGVPEAAPVDLVPHHPVADQLRERVDRGGRSGAGERDLVGPGLVRPPGRAEPVGVARGEVRAGRLQ